MATGKELARMLECGCFKEDIASKDYFRNAQIYDKEGNKITIKEAKNEVFCFAKVTFKGIDYDKANLIASLLRNIASTSSESMVKNVSAYYGFHDIIIS